MAAKTLFYFSMCAFSMLFLIPCIFFTVLYGIIVYTLYRRKKSQNMTKSRLVDKATTELTKTAIIVTIIFLLTMALENGYFSMGCTGIILCDVSSIIQDVGWWMCSFNSAANPFVYALLMPVYRRSIMTTFGCKKSSR